MIHGEVVGEIWATIKVSSLTGLKLLIVRPDGDLNLGGPGRLGGDIVAADLVGAGVGDKVIVALGKAARLAHGDGDRIAIEAAIVGIVDGVHYRDEPKEPIPQTPDLSATKPRTRRPRLRKTDDNGESTDTVDHATRTPSAGESTDGDVEEAQSIVRASTNSAVDSADAPTSFLADRPTKKMTAKRPTPDPETGDLFGSSVDGDSETMMVEEDITSLGFAKENSSANATDPKPSEPEIERKPRRAKKSVRRDDSSAGSLPGEGSTQAPLGTAPADPANAMDDEADARRVVRDDGPGFDDLDAIWEKDDDAEKEGA